MKELYIKKETLHVGPDVGFDWYVTGYCISHLDENWDLLMMTEEIDLFLKGLGSSPSPKGKIHHLNLVSLDFLQVYTKLKTFFQLASLCLHYCIISDDDQLLVIL